MTRTVLLGDMAQKITKGTTPTTYGASFTTSGVNFIKVESITAQGGFLTDKFVHIDEDTHKNMLKRSIIEEGDILLTMAGAIGRVAQVPKEILPANTNQAVSIIRIDRDDVDSRYIRYFLETSDAKSQFLGGITQSAQPNLSLGNISKIQVPLPDLETQKKIADVLGTIDEKIELNRKMNETLEQMGQTLFRHYFITNPEAESWSSETVGSKYNVILGGTPSRAKQEYWVDGTIGWINSGKVNEFRIIEPSELITELALSKSAAKLLPKGTTVLAITGATLGQVSRLENEFAANQSVIGVVPSSHFTNEFAYFWINHNINKIIGHQTGGAQQHINKSNVSSFELIVPPPAELEGFQKEVSPIMEKIALQCEEIQSLTNLRNSLLPRLISGLIKL